MKIPIPRRFIKRKERVLLQSKKQDILDISNESKVEIPIQPERKSISDIINECKEQFPLIRQILFRDEKCSAPQGILRLPPKMPQVRKAVN